jgi:hypothetical protein
MWADHATDIYTYFTSGKVHSFGFQFVDESNNAFSFIAREEETLTIWEIGVRKIGIPGELTKSCVWQQQGRSFG